MTVGLPRKCTVEVSGVGTSISENTKVCWEMIISKFRANVLFRGELGEGASVTSSVFRNDEANIATC